MVLSVEEYKNKALKELGDFFGFELEPKVIIVKDRDEIDKLLGYKTENWLVGWADKDSIYILDKDNYEKESIHKYSDENYSKLIKHELAHVFFLNLSNNKSEPDWLWEGLSLYLAEQNKDKPLKLENFLEYYEKKDQGVFKESGWAVQFLIEKFGKEKLIELIKSLAQVKDKNDFYKQFNKLYGFELTYKNFNE